MKKIDRLLQEARQSCERRGHHLRRFERENTPAADGLHIIATTTCRVCGRSVTVLTHPLPNQIEIGGEAVAITCEGVKSMAKRALPGVDGCLPCRYAQAVRRRYFCRENERSKPMSQSPIYPGMRIVLLNRHKIDCASGAAQPREDTGTVDAVTVYTDRMYGIRLLDSPACWYKLYNYTVVKSEGANILVAVGWDEIH